MDKQKNYMLFSERKKLADEYEEWVNKPLEDGSKIKDCVLSVITFMEIKGFCKIPEGAVLLTDKKDIQQYEWSKMCDKMGIFKLIEKECAKTRKETVEKFAERLKEKFAYDVERCKAVDEIAKEFTGGKS